jgi:hypothetical protein
MGPRGPNCIVGYLTMQMACPVDTAITVPQEIHRSLLYRSFILEGKMWALTPCPHT